MSASAFAEFNRLLASAVEGGMAPEAAVDLLAAQAGSRALRDALQSLSRDLRDGAALPDALARHPSVFPPDYCALVRAGVEGRRLPDVLRMSATYHALRARVRHKIGRLAVHLGIGLALCAFIGIWVYVIGSGFVAMFRQEVGWAYEHGWVKKDFFTWFFMNFESAMAWILGLIFGGAAALLGLAALLSTRKAGYWIPLWGRLLRSRDLSLFCVSMAMKGRAGAAPADALRISGEVLRNRHARAQVEAVRARVEEGEPLSVALHHHPWFPRTLAWAVALGEERGAVPESLETLASLYAAELERNFEAVLVFLTPLGLVFMGNVVMATVLGAMLPLFRVMFLFSS